MTGQKHKRTLWILFVTVLIDMMCATMVIPTLLYLFTGTTDHAKALGASTGYILFGLLFGLFGLAQFFSNPILGQLSDKFGRKKTLIWSTIGTVVGNVIFAFGVLYGKTSLMFTGRIIDGLTGGNMAIVNASALDLSNKETKAQYMGYIASAHGLGYILGPVLGGIFSDTLAISGLGISTPFWVAAFLALVNVFVIKYYLTETKHNFAAKYDKIDWTQSLQDIKQAFTMKEQRLLYFMSFLYSSGFTLFLTFIGVHLIEKFALTELYIGLFFLCAGLIVIITQVWIVPFISKKIPLRIIVPVSLFATAGLVVSQYFPDYFITYLCVIAPLTIADSVAKVSSSVMVSNSTSDERQGVVMGINSSVNALGSAIPAILSGFIAALFSAKAPFLAGAVLIAIAALVSAFIKTNDEESLKDSWSKSTLRDRFVSFLE